MYERLDRNPNAEIFIVTTYDYEGCYQTYIHGKEKAITTYEKYVKSKISHYNRLLDGSTAVAMFETFETDDGEILRCNNPMRYWDCEEWKPKSRYAKRIKYFPENTKMKSAIFKRRRKEGTK